MKGRLRARAVVRSVLAALTIAAVFVNCGENRSVGPEIHLAADTDSTVTVSRGK